MAAGIEGQQPTVTGVRTGQVPGWFADAVYPLRGPVARHERG